MNINIDLSFKFILGILISILILFFGLQLEYRAISNLYGMKHAVPLEQIEMANIKKGLYVKGEISYLLGYYYRQPLNNKMALRTEFCEWSDGTIEYIIPFRKGASQFITILVNEREKEFFKIYTDVPNLESTYKFFGKVVNSKGVLDYDTLEKVFVTTDKEVINSKVSSIYAIKLLNASAEKEKILRGLFICAGGILLFGKMIKKYLTWWHK